MNKQINEFLETKNAYIPLEGYGRVYTEANVKWLLAEFSALLTNAAQASPNPNECEPTCVECGQPLSSADVERGWATCADCLAIPF